MIHLYNLLFKWQAIHNIQFIVFFDFSEFKIYICYSFLSASIGIFILLQKNNTDTIYVCVIFLHVQSTMFISVIFAIYYASGVVALSNTISVHSVVFPVTLNFGDLN